VELKKLLREYEVDYLGSGSDDEEYLSKFDDIG
jgi:hypothetical protein